MGELSDWTRERRLVRAFRPTAESAGFPAGTWPATVPATPLAAFCTVSHGKMLTTVQLGAPCASMIAPLGANVISGPPPAVGDTYA